MSSSDDDDVEALPESVTNYDFVDEREEPISFAVLPVHWSEGETFDGGEKQIFLRGITDDGLRKIYKQVIAWKVDLTHVKPEISVLSKDENWITLQRPRKIFEEIIRSILITVHCLHFIKYHPNASAKLLWDNMSRVFSLYEVSPSQNDLVDHYNLIADVVKREEALCRSKFLLTFLEEKPKKSKVLEQDLRAKSKSSFIVDDTSDEPQEDESVEELDQFDSVCSICDNGGDLLCCEGECLRSFHATEDVADLESYCETLGFSHEEVEEMLNFFCENCKHKQHQCFSCGKLGSSDKSSGAEVFRCVSATCGHFYHPQCVAKLLHKEDEAAADELQREIIAGGKFLCPVHRCSVCKQLEKKDVPELQFAMCRRCPKSYHRKCLPRRIAFEYMEEEDIPQRAWEDLLPNRILIYCLKHEIDDELRTPIRNHIIFPDVGKKKKRTSEMSIMSEKVVSKKRCLAANDIWGERAAIKTSKLSGHLLLDPKKKYKVNDAPRKSLGTTKSVCMEGKVSSTKSVRKVPLKEERSSSISSKGSERAKPRKQDKIVTEPDQALIIKQKAENFCSSALQLDSDSQRRILGLIKESFSSITMEGIVAKHKVPSTHTYSSRSVVDKTITLGKVEGSVEALRTALQKLEKGGTIDDASVVCEPEVLNQIIRWKNKLRVYLSPFLYGPRYTSFGRHFTKVDKLEEIVERLHWYVEEGDMVVDFCCGANDFSCLMKKKLEATGKKCSFMNYDIVQPKNDFNFEKRDWMTVRPKELPPGSKLIMGLNPPFGVNAALANKFIDKALEFSPKLLILIVPPETQRLDDKKKRQRYNLIWVDDQKLSGKSFYLPGSVDVHDKQIEQWNVNAPLLYLWSHPDWLDKHRAIANKHGHETTWRGETFLQDHDEPRVLVNPRDNQSHLGDSMCEKNYLQSEPDKLDVRRSMTCQISPSCNFGSDDHEMCAWGSNHSNRSSKKRRRGKNKKFGETLADDKHNGQSAVRVGHIGMPHRSPSIATDDRSTTEDSSRAVREKLKGMHYHSTSVATSGSSPVEDRGRTVRKSSKGMPRHSPSIAMDSRSPIEDGSSLSRDMSLCSEIADEDHRSERYEELLRSSNAAMDCRPTLEGYVHNMHFESKFEEDHYQNLQPCISGAGSQFLTGYGSARSSIPDEVTRQYSFNTEEPAPGVNYRWSSDTNPPPDYGIRNIDERYAGHMRNSNGSDTVDGDDFRRDFDPRTLVHLYGQQNADFLSQRGGFLSGYRSSLSQGRQNLYPHHIISAANSSYDTRHISAMQRYAPRLDELNHPRVRPLDSERHSVGISGIYGSPGPHSGLGADSRGFRRSPL